MQEPLAPLLDNRVTRRDWIRLSAAGVLGTSMSGWALPELARAIEGKPMRAKSCILLFMNGGPSQHHTFHLPAKEPDIKATQTAVPGLHIAEFFPKFASVMNDVALVRSMSTGNNVHERARVLMHTGYNPNGTVVYPSIGNIGSAELGKLDAELPNFVSIYGGSDGLGSGPLHRNGPVYLGPKHAPVPVTDPDRGIENLKTAVGLDELDQSAGLLDRFDKRFQDTYQSAAIGAHRANYQKALQLLRSDKMKAFELEKESAATRDKYGKHSFSKACLLARRLVEVECPLWK